MPRTFEAGEAAKARKMTPSEFDALSDMDRARILAHDRLAGLRAAHVAKVQREVSAKNAKTNGAGGKSRDPYADFFGGVGE
jgi:hypothetical protein